MLLDVNDDENGGRSAFEALVRSSDILVANATAESLERLRCSPSHLDKLNPDLVLCRFDAWGGPNEGIGPRATHLGYDDNVQAALGIMERFGGGLGRVEEHAHIGTIDVIAGVGGALASVAALYLRETRRQKAKGALSDRGYPATTAISSASADISSQQAGEGGRKGLLVARASLAALGQLVQFPFCCGVPSTLAAEAQASTTTLGPLCRGEHALMRCYEAADGEWLLLHASLHPSLHPSCNGNETGGVVKYGEGSKGGGGPGCEGSEESKGGEGGRLTEELARLAAAHPALAKAVSTAITQLPLSSKDDLLSSALAGAFRSCEMTASAWVELLRSKGVAAASLCSLNSLRAKCTRPESAFDLYGPSFQFLMDADHPAGSALTYFAPTAIRPQSTPLVAPLPAAPRYGEHTREVLTEAGVDASELIARGAASEGWAATYLPGCTPPASSLMPQLQSKEPLKMVEEETEELCPVCFETIIRRVQLACGHSFCGGCATRCGETGHRRCPVCRTPHLLHPEQLAMRSKAWRGSYASWRGGGHRGARGELSTISTPNASADDEAGGRTAFRVGKHGIFHLDVCGLLSCASKATPQRCTMYYAQLHCHGLAQTTTTSPATLSRAASVGEDNVKDVKLTRLSSASSLVDGNLPAISSSAVWASHSTLFAR